ncbi:hypothetical protein [Nocardiopsis halotolerans]|uniref:hypothetical protein n=1 Tax=Nocardiopsis halotolerans TaxID=124252 RepID=UPI0005934FEF|nr:hypothetical protein [Nocardiopsis halotolerans]
MSAATPSVPDYDDLSIGALDERVRSLSAECVRELIAYEESHADRMDVLELLKDRLQGMEGEEEEHEGAGPEGGADPGADAAHVDAVPRSAERPPDRGRS